MLITFRNGTAKPNYVLKDAEPGWDSTGKIFKVGDGITPWSELPAIGGVYAGLDVVGLGLFVVLESDADATSVPNGTFIVRLPEGWTP